MTNPIRPLAKKCLAGTLVAMLLTIPAVGYGGNFLPLELGNFWEHQERDGSTIEIQTIVGTIDIFGNEPFIKEYAGSGPNAGLQNFWSSGSNGETYSHGFLLESGFGLLYDPPVLYLPETLELGATWTTEVDYFDYATLDYLGTLELTYGVLADGPLVVPAGEFYGYGIGPVSGATELIDGHRLDGTVTTDQSGDVYDWFAEGVGNLRYLSINTYELSDYGIPSPVEEASWGSVKLRFQ